MSIRTQINRPIWARKLYTSPDTNLGANMFAYGPKEVKWTFEFDLVGSSTNKFVESKIHFVDTHGLTQKLLAEFFFKTRLPDVYKLEVHSLSVLFGYESTSKYEPTKHLVGLKGNGHHSFIANDASDFLSEAYTNEAMMGIVMSLLELATTDIIP